MDKMMDFMWVVLGIVLFVAVFLSAPLLLFSLFSIWASVLL